MDIVCSLEVPDSATPIIKNGKLVGYFIPGESVDGPVEFDPTGWTEMGYLED